VAGTGTVFRVDYIRVSRLQALTGFPENEKRKCRRARSKVKVTHCRKTGKISRCLGLWRDRKRQVTVEELGASARGRSGLRFVRSEVK